MKQVLAGKPATYLSDSLVEHQIREAMAAGEFDNLPGFGKPIPGIDEPHDDLWWVKQKLQRERLSLLPPALQIRMDVERFWAALPQLTSEAAVRVATGQINQKIHEAHYTSIWGPPNTTMPLDVEEVLERWRRTRS